MKKSSLTAMVLGTVSGVLFALGICMALIPEWEAFVPGIICGCVGLLLGIITWVVWRKMEHKEPIHISGRTIFIPVLGIVGVIGFRCRHVSEHGMGQNGCGNSARSCWHSSSAILDTSYQRY